MLRHLYTDRLYTMNRVVGGVLEEIWGVSKLGMQVNKIKRGKKPLTEAQRDHAHTMYSEQK